MDAEGITYYEIAGFQVRTNCKSPYMLHKLEPYRMMQTPIGPFLDLCCPLDRQLEQPAAAGSFEYSTTFLKLSRQLVANNAFCFHASALAIDEQGILFSADSGVGKSTQAALWKRYLSDRQVVQLNDDKPIIRFQGEVPYAYGTPWSGKHNLDTNSSAPAKVLVFLEQAAENTVERIPTKKVLPLVLEQVLGCRETPEEFYGLLTLLDRFIRSVVVYRLRCNISKDAVSILYKQCREDGVLR